MKILMSLGIFYPSQIGGPANTLYWLGKGLAKNGFIVKAVVSDKGINKAFAPRGTWYNLDGIFVKYCETWKYLNYIKLTILTLLEIPRTDIVMLSSVFYKPNFFVGLVALIKGKTIIWSPRGELLIPRGMVKRAYLKTLRFLFNKRVYFHATSHDEEKSINRILAPGLKCLFIPNYMELPLKVECQNPEKYFLYVGRIAPIKALENLIEGIANSKLFVKDNYKLFLAGRSEGEYYESLVDLVGKLNLTNSVVFKGLVTGSEKYLIYAGAKALMLVSHTENFGNVVIEALAQGTPAITSKGTPWEILEIEKAGFWINNSPTEIGENIDKLIAMPEKDYQKMRINALNLCQRDFDIEKNIDKWVNILKEISNE